VSSQSASRFGTPEDVARAFHDAYESLASSFGYKTRDASAVPWDDVPENNKALMIATVRNVLIERRMAIKGGPSDGEFERGRQAGIREAMDRLT
jgi:hypothetical protein